ncbi:hypothetical protein MHY30_04650 [Microbacterium sp. ACRRU]|uniref:hypothetical protein n=1 Tax=Microbacterium sp. ACRRU TaxID=2918204 RepID=UPI001EF74D04|nr:hypothetical protein [Microbacterium sp. ACRRU]MCG7416793.1 hypothetical protein [Microbacterium sp. ACRRU]
MAYFIALGVLVLLGIGASAWLIHTDGYGRVPTDPRRLPGGVDATTSRTPPARATTPENTAPPRTAAIRPGRAQRRAARA